MTHHEEAIGSEARPLRVAIIGSGPSGFFAAAALLKQQQLAVQVDLFDRLPTPYGLVRGGVAPDHQKIKSVTRVFERSAAHPAVRFYGNVELGNQITVEDLAGHYDRIVYALGNESDRRMGIPGESLTGCTPASVLVGWYNAHPDYVDAQFDWSSRRIVVIGNGNVAIDVARILAKTAESLRETDIAQHALEELHSCNVEQITVVGRRGPFQSSFTPAELAEVAALDNVDLVVDPTELTLDPASNEELTGLSATAAARRNLEFFRAAAASPPAGRARRVRFRFCLSAVEVIGDERGRVSGVRFERNELERDGESIRPRGSGRFEVVDADWVFVSIGYHGRRLPGVPFDEARGTIANVDGRVVNPETGEVVPDQYVVGWAKSGPRGLIGNHKAASTAVVELILDDLRRNAPTRRPPRRAGSFAEILERRGIGYVSFDDWKRIDDAEVERGRDRGSPRVKFSRVPEMLDLLEREDEPGE